MNFTFEDAKQKVAEKMGYAQFGEYTYLAGSNIEEIGSVLEKAAQLLANEAVKAEREKLIMEFSSAGIPGNKPAVFIIVETLESLPLPFTE